MNELCIYISGFIIRAKVNQVEFWFEIKLALHSIWSHMD